MACDAPSAPLLHAVWVNPQRQLRKFPQYQPDCEPEILVCHVSREECLLP